MQISPVAIARAHPGYLAVRVVEDHILAGAVPGHDLTLPPGEHGPPSVALHLEVPGGAVLAIPHELPLAVYDHGAVLACALLQGDEDVAGVGVVVRLRGSHPDCGRAKVGARAECPHALRGCGWDAWQRPNLRGAQGANPWGVQGRELRAAPEQFAAHRVCCQGEVGDTGAERCEKAAPCEPGAHHRTLHYSRALFDKLICLTQAAHNCLLRLGERLRTPSRRSLHAHTSLSSSLRKYRGLIPARRSPTISHCWICG